MWREEEVHSDGSGLSITGWSPHGSDRRQKVSIDRIAEVRFSEIALRTALLGKHQQRAVGSLLPPLHLLQCTMRSTRCASFWTSRRALLCSTPRVALCFLSGGLPPLCSLRAPGTLERVLPYVTMIVKNNAAYPAESLHGVLKADKVLSTFLTPEGASLPVAHMQHSAAAGAAAVAVSLLLRAS